MKTEPTTKSKSSVAYDGILSKLIAGRYTPGDIVDRKILVAELDVSLAPISEAIMLLEYQGFLKTFPRQGTLVHKARWKDLRSQLVLCSVLSDAAIELIDQAKLQRLMPRLEVLAASADLQDSPWKERWHSEIDFHTTLVSAAKNAALTRCFRKEFQLYQFYKTHLIVLGNNEIHDRHMGLVQKLRSADVNVIKRAVGEHFAKGIEPYGQNDGQE